MSEEKAQTGGTNEKHEQNSNWGQTDRQMDGWMESTEGWKDKWMDGHADGQTDGYTHRTHSCVTKKSTIFAG